MSDPRDWWDEMHTLQDLAQGNYADYLTLESREETYPADQITLHTVVFTDIITMKHWRLNYTTRPASSYIVFIDHPVEVERHEVTTVEWRDLHHDDKGRELHPMTGAL